jgi:hypothetical protein
MKYAIRWLYIVALAVWLCGCSVQVRFHKPGAFKIHPITEKPAVCHGDPIIDENGFASGCDDFTEPPYDNHFPACPWQEDSDTMSCDDVS